MEKAERKKAGTGQGLFLRLGAVLLLWVVAAVSSSAQTSVEDRIAALEALLQQQNARIQQLEQELVVSKGETQQVKLTNTDNPRPFIRPAVLVSASPTLGVPPTEVAETAAPLAPPLQAAPTPTYYPFTAVSGIYTDSSTKDLGKLSGISLFEGIKVRGWVSTYYDYNFNTPETGVVEKLRPLSIVKGPQTHIEGRLFDTHSNSITLDLAELEVEKVPERGGVGFKFDMAFGDTQNLIGDTIKGALGDSSINDFERIFQHASIAYLAPVGRGLRFDFGKFVTHIGGETIENVKNANFSHSFFYTYAIPFQDYGMRTHYDWSDKVYTEFYLLNGWNAGFDINRGKTYGVTLGYTYSPQFSLVANWLGGPEQVNNSDNWRNLGDFQIYINPTPKFRTMLNIDAGRETKALSDGSDTSWQGVTEVLRYRVTDRFDPSLRVEWFRDLDGFATAVPQNLLGVTLTLDYFLGKGEFNKVLIRPEFRWDHSNTRFFSRSSVARRLSHQATVGLNLIYYF